MEETQSTHNIAIIPTPGMGHLIPLTIFAKRLIAHHNFTITFIIPNDGSPPKAQNAVLDALPKTITSIFLPPVNLDDLPGDVKVETRICLTLSRSISSIRKALYILTSTTHLVALVVDLFGTEAFDVAKEFKIPSYMFFPSTTAFFSFFLHLPNLDETYSCDYKDLPEPVMLPGCVPLHGRDLPDPAQDGNNEAYKWLLHTAKRYRLADGVLLNSFNGLEGSAIKAFKEGRVHTVPPVYPIGPLIQIGSSDVTDSTGCLRWLDNQPRSSVLFVSFGSGGALSLEQVKELALGLEESGHRFLWVIKSPTKGAADATFFTVQSMEDPLTFLPEGFLARTKEMGLVVPSWAPQIQVLSHDSTGGFLSHSGWNSVLESVVHGVPLIAWPLYAEQKMNAVMLVEDINVALRPKADEKGLIGRQEIAKVVKSLMEGEEGKRIQSKMSELKDEANKVLSNDGSSTEALSEVAHIWKSCKII
ncbi:hydroquinone glucosyltransferase-like [Telopea speciosissima]|uniref:hydroquinone glucosyltransferase-like n=1 Tax=Telopea speciosissima TaxID=54955 RepID=UPI001CC43783|nr:hydroquinone glucosyltransferase-like [Telopea speciosissima]